MGKGLRRALRKVADGSEVAARALVSRDARRREEIARGVLAGFAQGPEPLVVAGGGMHVQARDLARVSVVWADALIEALDDRTLEDAVMAHEVDIDAGGS